MMGREEQAFILEKTETAALEQQPAVSSSSALLFDYPSWPPPVTLPDYDQWFVCIPVAFWFQHRGV